MRRPQIFISHSAHDETTLALLPVVDARLTGLGFDVFIDRVRLEPGAEWRKEIGDALRRSHAGLLLISKPAFESSWVQHEASILKSRRDYSADVVVIPVLIGCQPKQLADRPFDALALTEIEAVSHDAADFWQRLEGVLKPVVERYRAPTRAQKLKAALARKLKALVPSEEPLRAALDKAGDGNPPPDAPLAEQLAARLIELPLDNLGEVLVPLAAQVKDPKLVQIVDLVTPDLWVDALAADRIERTAAQPAPRRAIAVNGSIADFTPRMYVARARDPDLKWPVVPVTGVDGGTADELLEEVRRAIAERIYNKPDYTLEKLRTLLRALPANYRLFVVLPKSVTGEHVAKLRGELPDVVFFLLTGMELRTPSALPPAEIELVYPTLEGQIETEAEMQYLNACAIVKPVD